MQHLGADHTDAGLVLHAVLVRLSDMRLVVFTGLAPRVGGGDAAEDRQAHP
jgi:hypothetical protein